MQVPHADADGEIVGAHSNPSAHFPHFFRNPPISSQDSPNCFNSVSSVNGDRYNMAKIFIYTGLESKSNEITLVVLHNVLPASILLTHVRKNPLKMHLNPGQQFS